MTCRRLAREGWAAAARRAGALLAVCALLSGVAAAQPSRDRGRVWWKTLSDDEAARWQAFVVPLPKRMELLGQLVVPRGGVEISVGAEVPSSPLVAEAVSELRRATGVNGKGRGPAAFTVTLHLASARSALGRLKNCAQAYRIRPMGEAPGLRMQALTPIGLLYAARTLVQLIEARASDEQVVMPAVRITDWPDLEVRGLWGADSFLQIPWMARLKLNTIEQISALWVDRQGRPHAALKPGREPMVKLGPRMGVEPVPVVLHLDQLAGKGLFEAYPQLRAKGGKPGCICYSRPEFVPVLAGWIAQLARLPGVREVDLWLSENLRGLGGCHCEKCRREPYPVLELRTVLAAWRQAQEKLGRPVGLRVLTSEETYRFNKRLLSMIPRGVKVWYYHSLLTYNCGEEPIIQDAFADFARRGGWAGLCFNVVADVGRLQPFTCPHFIEFRLREVSGKGLSGVLGYATPRLPCARFNIEALAEWSWNVRGRTPREFATAWAVRRGLRAPELFADWCETLGPVAWDVYGSAWPGGDRRKVPGHAAELLRTGKLPPLGTVTWGLFRAPWGDIKSAEQLEGDVRAAGRALQLARRLGERQFIEETLVVDGYVRSLWALWHLRELAPDGRLAERNKSAARRWFEEYHAALSQAADALPRWLGAAAPDVAEECWPFARRSVGLLREMVREMAAVAEQWVGQ